MRTPIPCQACFKNKCKGDCREAIETGIMKDVNEALAKWGYHIVIAGGDKMRDYLFKIIKLTK
jgi:hypothetical protein